MRTWLPFEDGETIRESMTLDISRHYSRADVFKFDVRRERRGYE